MSQIKHLHEELESRKQEAYNILACSYNEEEIKELCRRFTSTTPNLIGKELDETTFYAIAALVLFMSVEVNLPPPNKRYFIKDEDMAKIVLDAMNAALCLVEAGWKPGERHIEARLKQIRNQPMTRQRINEAYDDIRDKFIEYESKKGHPPKNFGIFLNYLLSYGTYDIDKSTGRSGTINHRTWDKPRAIGTISNWFRKIKKSM